MPFDRNDPERLLIRQQELAARPKPPQPSHGWPPSELVPAPPRRSINPGSSRPMRTLDRTKPLAGAAQKSQAIAAKNTNQPTIHGRAIKVTIVIDPTEIVAITLRDGVPGCILRIDVAGRMLTADLAAKSLRRAQAAIREHGADGVATILQGKLAGERVDEAGLSAQPKADQPKAPPPKAKQGAEAA